MSSLGLLLKRTGHWWDSGQENVPDAPSPRTGSHSLWPRPAKCWRLSAELESPVCGAGESLIWHRRTDVAVRAKDA